MAFMREDGYLGENERMVAGKMPCRPKKPLTLTNPLVSQQAINVSI